MRRCFLHIGTHKTGTTSIQVQLNEHRPHLARHGFLYPKAGIPGRLAGHHNIAWQLLGDRRFRPEFGTFDDLFSEIQNCDHDVILSSEDFECRVENLGSFIGEIEQRGRKVAIIIYLRDQVSYARTLYLELLSLGYTDTFGDFLREVVERRLVRWQDSAFAFDYRLLLDRLPPATTVIPRPFNRQTSVVSDFTSILGLPASDANMDADFRTNAQEPISLAIARLYRNRTGKDLRGDCKATMEEIARAFDGVDIDISDLGKQRIIAAVEASNRVMEERYGIPELTPLIHDAGGLAATPRSGMEMEAVFSTATLGMVDALCESESRRRWSIFGWRGIR